MSESLIRSLIRSGRVNPVEWGDTTYAPSEGIVRRLEAGDIAGAIDSNAGPNVRYGRWTRGANDEYINRVAAELIKDYIDTGVVSDKLIEFYAARGVPLDSLERLKSGELPMDADSRRQRATQMGLVFDDPTIRQDAPSKTQFRGRNRGGLVYTGLNRSRAASAAQAQGQFYPLIGEPVLGLHTTDAEDFNLLQPKYRSDAEDWVQAMFGMEPADVIGDKLRGWELQAKDLKMQLEEQSMLPWSPKGSRDEKMIRSLRELGVGHAEPGTQARIGDFSPQYHDYEVQAGLEVPDVTEMSGKEYANFQMRDLLNEQGVGGILVADEGPLSIAYHNAPNIRHADLSLLDDRARQSRDMLAPNIYRSAPPIALAAAASQSQGAEMEDIPRATSKAEKRRTLDFIYQEQREGQPLYEYLSQQEQGVVPSDRGAYASAVEDSLNRPVISVQYAREKVGDKLVPSDAFPSGFMSVRDYIHLEGQKAYSEFVEGFKATRGKLTPEVVQMAEQARDRVFRAADDAEGMLAGTLKTNSPYANLMQSTIQQAVAAHSPGGEYAQFGGRTQSEDAEAQQQYGSGSNFMLTAAGRQNYEAQRLLDLWSATDENYGPASTMSQVQRAIGGFVSPAYNMLVGNTGSRFALPRLAGEEWDEMGRMSKPDGKYGYAAEMYYRSANDTPGQETSVYTPEGRSKFVDNEMTTPTGLANATMANTDYPMANWYQSVGMRAREIPNTIGNWLGGGDESLIQNLQELRRNYNRTTPVMPDGADTKEFTEIGKQLQSADARMSGYNAAQLGPKMADAWNSTIGLIPGLKTDRFYLPDAAVDALDMPIEALTDPINVSMNVMAPGIGAVKGAVTGGAKQAGNNLIRSLAKLPTRMGGDAIEETTQGMGLASAMSSPFDYFFPPRTNLLMGTKDPNDKDYDAQLKINTEQAKFDQMDAADRYGRMVGRKK